MGQSRPFTTKEEECFLTLLKKNEGRWLRRIGSEIAHPQDAKDLLHEVLLEVFENPDFDPCHPGAGKFIEQRIEWRIKDFNSKKRPGTLQCSPEDEESDEKSPAVPEPADTRERRPPDQAMSAEARQRLWAALASLSPEKQVIVVLRMVELSTKEIAVLLGLPETTVQMRYYHAKQELKEMLGEDMLPD